MAFSVKLKSNPTFSHASPLPKETDLESGGLSPKSKSYISTKFHEIAEMGAAYLKSIRIGAVVGAIGFCVSTVIGIAFNYFGFVYVPNPQYEDFIRNNLLYVAVGGPVLEECIFRGGLQTGLKKIAEKCLPDISVPILPSRSIKLAALIVVIASAIFFGALHFFGGGIMQVCTATVNGLLLGILKETEGLSSSISAHITNNSICVGIFLAIKS